MEDTRKTIAEGLLKAIKAENDGYWSQAGFAPF